MSGYTRPRAIEQGDNLAHFASGEASLDDYLRRRAWTNHLAGASRCYVSCHDGAVVGYYALASASVYHRDLGGRYRRNMPDPIPVVLLSRLAVDVQHQHSGLGRHLLLDAIARTVQAADVIGVRAMLVHALNDSARQFYLHHGFESSPTDPMHLLMLVKDARAALGLTDANCHPKLPTEMIRAIVHVEPAKSD